MRIAAIAHFLRRILLAWLLSMPLLAAQAQRRRQRHGLAHVAGAAVGDRPGKRRSFRVWH